jgi:O-antigen/teichoic acid export membrane protein
MLLLLSALLLSYSEFCLAPLRALGRYDVEAVLSMCGNTLQFALAGGVVWLGGSPTSVAIAIVGSRLVYLLACWLALARAAPMVSLRPERGGVRSTIQTLWPYGIDSALTSAWNFVDIIAVRVLFDAQVAGLYAAGQRCIQGVLALAPIVGNVTIPGIARHAARQSGDTWRAAAHAGIFMAGIGLAFATPMIAFPGQIVGVVFGSDFSELSEWLPWFGAILIARFSGAAFGVILTALGLQKKRITGQIMAVGSYVVCIALVDILGGGMISALAALLLAMAIMGSSYAVQLYSAKRRNWIGIRQPMTE